MPHSCAVSTCTNRGPKPNEFRSDDDLFVSYFSFPKDPELRLKWIKACGRKDRFNPNTSRICSDHFREYDFVRDLKAELLGYEPSRKFIKKGSVPTVNVALEFEEINLFNDCDPEVCQHSCEFCTVPAKKKTDKSTNTKPIECLSCFLLKREIVFCKKKMKPFLTCAKMSECRLHAIRKKIDRIKEENKELRRQLRLLKQDDEPDNDNADFLSYCQVYEEDTSHKRGKKFICIICSYTTNTKSRMKRHIRIHTGEKPFECNQCDKRFSQKGELQRHLSNHTGEKKFECDLCNKRFARKDNLATHQQTHKKGKYVCSVCSKKFVYNTTYEKHCKTHSPNTYLGVT